MGVLIVERKVVGEGEGSAYTKYRLLLAGHAAPHVGGLQSSGTVKLVRLAPLLGDTKVGAVGALALHPTLTVAVSLHISAPPALYVTLVVTVVAPSATPCTVVVYARVVSGVVTVALEAGERE